MKKRNTTLNLIGAIISLICFTTHAQTFQRATTQDNNNTTLNTKVFYASNAVDGNGSGKGDLNSASTVKANSGIVAGLAGYNGIQTLTYPGNVPAGTTTYIKISSTNNIIKSLLGSSAVSELLSSILLGKQQIIFDILDSSDNKIETYNTDNLNSQSARIVSNAAGDYYIAITPNSTYKSIKITNDLYALAGAANTESINIYGAFYNTSTDNCEDANYTSWAAGGGLLDVNLLSSGGVNNPEYAIDSNTSNYSELVLPTVSTAASVQQTVYFNGASNETYQIRLASTADVVNLNLVDNIEILGYNGSNFVNSTSLSTLLDLDLLGLLQSNDIITFPYNPGGAIDRITIKMSSLANVSLISNLRLYGVSKNPPELETIAATTIHTDGATLNATISNTDCLSSYGFEYSTDPDFAQGSGTQIPATNLTGGNFSYNLTGLNANETYYFRAYGIATAGTTYTAYGSKKSFKTEIINWDGSSWNNTTGPNTDGSDDVLFTGDYSSDVDGGGIAVDSLFVNSGVVINLKDNDNIDLYGSIDAADDHSIDAKEGSLTLLGEATQVLDGNDFVDNTLNIVEVNKDVDTELDAYNEINILDNFTITSGDLNLNNGANLVFKSSLTKTAIFGEVVDCTNTSIDYLGSSTTKGKVTVERFIKAKRAFRGLTAPVNSSTSIKENWQEGAQNTVADYSQNKNPNPGYGTHITGSSTISTGFDVTATNNPSIFTYDNSNQNWDIIDNTNTNTFSVGYPYLLMVRGDRSINTEFNNPAPTNTILRTSGELHLCDFTFTTELSSTANDYNFIGNPYQSPVDMNLLLNDSNNVNKTSYLVYYPHLNTNGVYVVVDVTDGTSVPNTPVNQYLQPGQAAFVITDTNASATITFKESHKYTTSTNDAVFRPSISNIDNSIRINLYKNSSELIDGVKLNLSNNYTFNQDQEDIFKTTNFDETFALVNNSENFAIVSEPAPNDSKVYPFSLINYRNSNYKFEIVIGFKNGLNFALKDNYLNQITNLNNEVNIHEFSVDVNDDSSNPNRFELIVTNETLSDINEDFLNFTVHPNPVTENYFNIESSKLSGKNVNVAIYSLLGKQVYNEDLRFNNKALKIEFNQSISTGVYIIKLNSKGETFTQKLIVK